MHWFPRMMLSKFEYAFAAAWSELADWGFLIAAFALAAGAIALISVAKRLVITASALGIVIAVTLAVSSAAHSKDKPYRPGRLHDGAPDLQGNWDHRNSTPLSRLKGFDSLAISKEQAASIDKIIGGLFLREDIPNDPDNFLADRSVEPIRGEYRSSLIVDPPDGRLPTTPAYDAWLHSTRNDLFEKMDGPEQRPAPERCISDHAALAPVLYNPGMNLHQIVQTKNTILFHSEAMHDARVIRMNSEHAPAAVTSWLGDSIGWWEGDTLVVETKHFTPSDTGRGAPFATYRISPQATVTERFTRVSNNQLDYSFTVIDPVNYTKPWTAESQFWRSEDQLFEYACHEGNHSLVYILQAARVLDAAQRQK